MQYCYMDSPLGELLLAGQDDALGMIGFPNGDKRRRHAPEWREEREAFGVVKEQLRAYFAGELRQFTLTLAPETTVFQAKVLQALQAIPYGETRSYGDIARAIGQPTASRAVGMANGRNPIPIIIPCHRVIGSDGSLTGFGGGLNTKRWLLAHEQSVQG